MGDEPYRALASRADSPNHQMTIEQLMDTRLCVSSLTTEQCHEFLSRLDPKQVKNAVFDRALCFPFDPWTEEIRASYGKQVQAAVKSITSFDNVTQNVYHEFASWRDVFVFEEVDFGNMEAHVKGFLLPSIDNVGVYSTFSDYTLTKTNGLNALLKIGQLILEIPILTSKRGVGLFVYDPLSRSVANILSGVTNDLNRRQILDAELEGRFLELAKRSDAVGLFPGLVNALIPGAEVHPYNVPYGRQLNMKNKRALSEQLAPAAKRSKVIGGNQYTGELGDGPQGALTPGYPGALSTEPLVVIEGRRIEPRAPQNPFSRPYDAGPIAPLFVQSAQATANRTVKSSEQPIKAERAEVSDQDQQQGQGQFSELQNIANGATQYQSEPREVQKATQQGQEEADQAGSSCEANTGLEGQQAVTVDQGEGVQQSEQNDPQNNNQNTPTTYDDMLRQIEAAMFKDHIHEPPSVQLTQAPALKQRIENTCNAIRQHFKRVADACKTSGDHAKFLGSLNDTAFALLWVIESCALNVAGTPLSAEVSRTLSRNTMVGDLWGCIRLAEPTDQKDLLDVKDHVGAETFGEKLERIIGRMNETGVEGYGDLRVILDTMRGAVSVPVQDPAT
ncbi:hypothetical protein J7T55_006108 [Diaporthe amygdali]|uniref:uncharacterized protein n=1 Tax=Phomopsis amygdali TaxID=1214568 RepID=UPI0022FF0D01|nr:uncharacterized protein J7T55_006108 [Diaporthe amygdali]KAJ0124767.1 hypothetical protein J7T55_006108 [Diaporthe amygdali]